MMATGGMKYTQYDYRV